MLCVGASDLVNYYDVVMTNTPRAVRWTISLCSTALFFLFCWLLNFVLGDIGNIPGPARSELSSSTALKEVEDLQASLREQVGNFDRDLTYQQTIKQGRRDTMDEARATWDQMMAEYRFVVASGQKPGSELTGALDQVRTHTASFDDRTWSLLAELAGSGTWTLVQFISEVKDFDVSRYWDPKSAKR